MTEKGQGGGDLVETFELNEITSLPYFRAPRSSERPEPIPYASLVSGCAAVSAMISSCSGPNRRGGIDWGLVNLFILWDLL